MREISKEFTKDMRKAISSYEKLKSYQDKKAIKWRLLLAMMFKDDDGRVIESWCLKMKIRRKDYTVIIDSVKNMKDAERELKREIKKDFRLYDTVRKYTSELQIICHSRGGAHAKNIRRYFTKLANIKLEINGEDLKELGYRPSPTFKRVLEEVFRQKISGKISGRTKELATAKELMKDYNKTCL